MPDKPREKKKGGWATILVVGLGMAVLLPILYVLSVGPANWLFFGPLKAMDYKWAVRWADAFYRPLEWIEAWFPPFREAVHWYIDLWV